jgi:hypothetical protein
MKDSVRKKCEKSFKTLLCRLISLNRNRIDIQIKIAGIIPTCLIAALRPMAIAEMRSKELVFFTI